MTSTVTTLSELRALREKATPGPWRLEKDNYGVDRIWDSELDCDIASCEGDGSIEWQTRKANAALIVALANLDLEKLLAEARLEEAEWWLNEAVDYPASESWIVARIAELRALAGSSGPPSGT